jgi:hypothetical protein
MILRVSAILILTIIILSGCSIQRLEKVHVNISPENLLLIEGQPFFPIGIYSVNPPSAFNEVKAAGFNTVHTYETKKDYLVEYVKLAQKTGLKVLIYPGDYMGNPKFDIDNVNNMVKDFARSSAILAWYLCDEPELQKVSPGQLVEEMNLVHELDSFHPVAIVLADQKKFTDYAETTDIFMVDPYPVPHRPLVDVAKTVDAARKAVGDKRPIWAVLQAFGYQNEKNKGWGWKREPTYQEMRAMTYLAIVRGVWGIFYYTYHGSQYFIKESPRHWENLKAIVGELRSIYPLLISPEITDFELIIAEPGSGQSSLYWTVRKVSEETLFIQAGTYLIAVNAANRPVTATFRVKQDQSNNIKVILGNRKLVSINGNFSDSFAPYEVYIYNLRYWMYCLKAFSGSW